MQSALPFKSLNAKKSSFCRMQTANHEVSLSSSHLGIPTRAWIQGRASLQVQLVLQGPEGPEGTKGLLLSSTPAVVWEEKRFGMRSGSPHGSYLSKASSAALPSRLEVLEMLCGCHTFSSPGAELLPGFAGSFPQPGTCSKAGQGSSRGGMVRGAAVPALPSSPRPGWLPTHLWCPHTAFKLCLQPWAGLSRRWSPAQL